MKALRDSLPARDRGRLRRIRKDAVVSVRVLSALKMLSEHRLDQSLHTCLCRPRASDGKKLTVQVVQKIGKKDLTVLIQSPFRWGR
ncbi:unnamed protein product [Gemmata massiliana]|uniref:Uncharacterized protein n=1 Tax=Gemmata massiliana TaxID=1210884 RepID=A0A6P2CRZ9_9BACT|nr:unnamed protein product [Gemmata massiliana]